MPLIPRKPTNIHGTFVVLKLINIKLLHKNTIPIIYFLLNLFINNINNNDPLTRPTPNIVPNNPNCLLFICNCVLIAVDADAMRPPDVLIPVLTNKNTLNINTR